MATYRAKRDGHLGKTPVRVVRGKEEIHAAHILEGDVFDWEGTPGSWMEPLEAEEAEKIIEPVDELARKKAIMDRLNEMGVPFFKGATTAQLEAKLAQAEAA